MGADGKRSGGDIESCATFCFQLSSFTFLLFTHSLTKAATDFEMSGSSTNFSTKRFVQMSSRDDRLKQGMRGSSSTPRRTIYGFVLSTNKTEKNLNLLITAQYFRILLWNCHILTFWPEIETRSTSPLVRYSQQLAQLFLYWGSFFLLSYRKETGNYLHGLSSGLFFVDSSEPILMDCFYSRNCPRIKVLCSLKFVRMTVGSTRHTIRNKFEGYTVSRHYLICFAVHM